MKKLKEFFLKERKKFKLALRVLWIAFIAIVIMVPTYFWAVSVDLGGLFGGMPSLRALENPENDLSSELISADGVSLGRYWRYNRSQATYDELSQELVTTLLSSEDHRFHDHSGVDPKGLTRAIVGQLTFSKKGGGSTITMQLAENLFNTMTENEGSLYSWGILKGLIIKTKEWIIAAQLEKNFTKEEIIAMYFNTVSFGSNAFGIKAAAETYFGKTPAELNLQESAVLIGLLQGVTRFNPNRNYDLSFNKRNQVLLKVRRYSDLINTDAAYDSIINLPIDLSQYNAGGQDIKGFAKYFRSVIKNDLMAWCEANGYDLWEDGLKIYTTIDSRMQQYAEEAVNEHMQQLQKDFNEQWKGKNPWRDDNQREIPNFLNRRIKQTAFYRQLVKKYGEDSDSVNIVLNTPKPMTVFSWEGEIDTVLSPLDSVKYYKHFLHTGFMSMEPQTGYIKAWVGGINHKYFKYDHVRQGKRQPGSTFKPFVYAVGLEFGYPPCYKLPDISPQFKVPDGVWRPRNSDGKYGTGELMTIRQAMARSINSITAQMMKKVDEANVVKFAHNVGIKSELQAVPSLCLGTVDVSVFEIVSAYSTFVNSGIYTEPYFITKIEDKNGNVIQNFVPTTKQAISEDLAYQMIYMLKGGVEEEGGTSRGLNAELLIDNEIGGKTGTTNSASDGWYMGLTNNLVSGVWVGGDERSIHFRNWTLGQGAKTARPIWENYMLKVYADEELPYEKGPFLRPKRGVSVSLNCDEYYPTESESDTTIVQPPTKPWNPDDETL